MIVILSSVRSNLDSPVEKRFGRSPWCIKYDTESDQWEAFENSAVALHGGAGVAAAQFVADQKVDMVISGDFGPNAAAALNASKIKMVRYPEAVKTIKDAVKFIKTDNQ